jgi:hypothetical protein
MAIELMARIWARSRGELDSSEKLVLTIMADRADADGLLWYAVATIADLTSFTERAVQKIMDRLIVKGIVKKLPRADRSNYYVIQMDRFPHIERKKRPKELGPKQFIAELDAEPDLFGTGEPGSGTGERRSSTGERGSLTGESRSPDSLNDPLNDSLIPGGTDSVVQFVLRRWNELAEKHNALAPARLLSPARQRQIELRTDEWLTTVTAADDDPSMEHALWRQVFEAVDSSRLLTGTKTDWAPTLDWVLGPKNFAKIMEGNYGQGNDAVGTVSAAGGDRSAVAAASDARVAVGQARQRQRDRASRSG